MRFPGRGPVAQPRQGVQRHRLVRRAVVLVRVAGALAQFRNALLGCLAPLGELLGQVSRCHVAKPVQEVPHPIAPQGDALRLVHQLARQHEGHRPVERVVGVDHPPRLRLVGVFAGLGIFFQHLEDLRPRGGRQLVIALVGEHVEVNGSPARIVLARGRTAGTGPPVLQLRVDAPEVLRAPRGHAPDESLRIEPGRHVHQFLGTLPLPVRHGRVPGKLRTGHSRHGQDRQHREEPNLSSERHPTFSDTRLNCELRPNRFRAEQPLHATKAAHDTQLGGDSSGTPTKPRGRRRSRFPRGVVAFFSRARYRHIKCRSTWLSGSCRRANGCSRNILT